MQALTYPTEQSAREEAGDGREDMSLHSRREKFLLLLIVVVGEIFFIRVLDKRKKISPTTPIGG